MNWPTRILGILVIGTVVSLIAVVSRQNLRTPRQVLEEVEQELQAENYDEQALLRRLASSIRRAEAGDLSLEATRELCADLRMARGKLYLEIGATREARNDFEALLENYRPGDREVRRLQIRAESDAGEVESALAHLDQLLREQPDFGSAMVEKGHLHQQLAERALELCDQKLRFVLVEADAERGSEIVRTLSSRDPADPARATIILELKQLFPASADESLGQILGFCEEASGHFASCREAYVNSFGLGLDPVALTRYLEILESAGRDAEALRLGTIVAAVGPARADAESALLLLRVLMDRGSFDHASSLTDLWLDGNQPTGAPFLRLGCLALYRAKNWSTLAKCAYRLRSIGTLEDEDICAFYAGLAFAYSSKPKLDKAMISLMDFANSRTADPFPGAREAAWRAIATLRNQAGQLSREREAIQAALGQDPANAGGLWLRRAEIQLETPHNGYRLPLDSWVQGMSLLPRRVDDLMEKFVELGELTLQAEERNIDVIFEDLKREGRKFPTRDFGPYVLFRIAQMHGEEGNWVAQLGAARRQLDKLPTFLPALDLVIDARLNLKDRERFIELVLERVELAGMDERSESLVSLIRLDEYSKPQLSRMMQADPRNTGRMVVTRWFYENGENSAAIETLETSTKSARTDEERLFGAQVLMATADYRNAMRWLDEIDPEGPLYRQSSRLAVRCALSIGKAEEIVKRLDELFEKQTPGAEEQLLLADLCLQVNQFAAARSVLARINPKALPNPGVVRMREVLLALRGGDPKVASATIERSAAFMSEEEYLVARLLLDSQREDWVRARRDALDLAKTPMGTRPLVNVLIDLIQGESARALENTSFAVGLTPLVPRWVLAHNIARLDQELDPEFNPAFGAKARAELDAFLNGRGQAVIDPREVAVLLLASVAEGFEPLVQASLAGMEKGERGTLWPLLMQSDLKIESKDFTGVVAVLEEILKGQNDCLPAWDLLEGAQAKNFGSANHPQVARVRLRRMNALALADPAGAAGLLVSAKRMREEGQLEEALRVTLNAQQLAPDWFEARISVAQLYSELGHWEPALEEWRSLVESEDPSQVVRSVAGYIRALKRASLTVPPVIRMSDIKAELDHLDAKLPDNPRVVLALAHIDLMIDENNPAFGLERAWSRLRTLRDRYEHLSLEDLQRGATQAWASFYVHTDPDSAEEFILSELHRQPGNLFLWRLLGRVYRDLGRFSDSIETLNRVSQMVPSEEVQMELAASYAALGADSKTVTRVVAKAISLRGLGKESAEGNLLIAEAMLSSFDEKSWNRGFELLEKVWDTRHQLASPELRAKFAGLFGRALLLRKNAGDARRAVNLLRSELVHTQVPYEREYFHCLIGLGESFVNVRE